MTAQEATKIAATALFEGDDLLPGTGGEAWKELFRAAKKFSKSDAYREQPFPVVSEGARCVLCQQTLKEGGPRLSRFSSFIQQETEKTALDAQEKVDQAQKQIAAIRIDALLSDEALLAEIQELHELLHQRIRDFIEVLAQRKTHVLLAMRSHIWTAAPILPPNPMSDIAALSQRLAYEAAELERAAIDVERKKIEHEFRELAARKRFGPRKPAVLAAIAKSQMYRKLQACIRATDTTAISKKSTELHQERVTADLTDALNTEFEVLGAKSIRVVLSPRTERGKPLQKLKLDLPSPASGAEEISQILSEGEQRILAIASFLAEAALVHHGSGLVFDDPVSSLDHNYRHLVAKRIVGEAAKRQVIVFTHDIFFLVCLREACAEQAVTFFPQNLVFQARRFGIVRPDLPFEGKSAASRVRSLRDLHQRADKLYRTGEIEQYEEMIRFGYGRLRDSWERMVEEVLLRDVVQRFRRGIETQKIREVFVDDLDVNTIHFGMSQCSQYVHDTAKEAQVPVPTPDEFIRDVEVLDKYIIATSDRAKIVGKARKDLLEVPHA